MKGLTWKIYFVPGEGVNLKNYTSDQVKGLFKLKNKIWGRVDKLTWKTYFDGWWRH